MKKLILSGALALMIGVFGFSQNTSTVLQNGTDLISGVNQAGWHNIAVQWQNPSGSGDNAAPGGVSNANQAYIDQAGSSNYGIQTQIAQDDLAVSKQRGNINESYQTQKDGWGKAVYVDQSGSGNIAYQTQSNAAGGSIAGITQIGVNNWAQQWQEGAFNEAYSLQNDFSNRSEQFQYGVGQWDTHNVEAVDQAGSSNYGYQEQGANSLGESAFLLQRGNINYSYQVQNGQSNVSNVSQYGVDHLSNTNQLGVGNTTNVIQFD